MNDEQTPALREAVENMRNMRQSYNQLALLAEQANKKGFAQLTIDGLNQQVILDIVPSNTTPLSLMQRASNVIEVDDNSMVRLTDIPLYNLSNCRKIIARKCLYLDAAYYNKPIGASIIEFYAPEAIEVSNPRLFFSSSLHVLYIPKLREFTLGAISEFIKYSIRLIDITIGKNLGTKSHAVTILNQWNPTEALLSDSTSLLTPEDITAGFTSNLEKLLYNIREHIVANLQDRTGKEAYTMQLSTEVKAAILADQPTSDAFTNKNWIIA